jgi:hypothetical protein
MTSDTQGNNKYIFAIGGKNNDAYSSPPSKANIVVCGKESFTADIKNPYLLQENKGGKIEEVVPKITYSKWFNFAAGDESNDKCGTISYRLVNKICNAG